jgi:RNA polymerase sigma-70 factor (ECF subfamily)
MITTAAPVANPGPSPRGTLGGTVAGAESFEEFFHRERDRLFRVLCLITGSRHEAEEIAQDAFVSMLERWDRLGDVEDLAGYLHRTAVNAFRKRYRRSRMMVRHAVDARLLVARALQDLTPRQRAAVVLTELLGYTAEAAGKELGIRPATVRALTFQARSALRAKGRLADG